MVRICHVQILIDLFITDPLKRDLFKLPLYTVFTQSSRIPYFFIQRFGDKLYEMSNHVFSE